MNKQLKTVMNLWDDVSPVLAMPKNDVEYNKLVSRMDELLDYLGDDETHPLNGLLHLMGDLVADYDQDHIDEFPKATGIEMLVHLMAEHGVKQSELPEIGSQGVVSEILNGKRDLNVRQIKSLAKRFGLSEQVFI